MNEETDTPFRTVGCQKCRRPIVILYYRDDRLMCDLFQPAITPNSGHTLPITEVEVLPAEDDLPEWRSKYEGMTREKPDPRGIWFSGVDVVEEIADDPRVEVTCRCAGEHFIDLDQVVAAARGYRGNWVPWHYV
jgi:hypothetical protein